MIPKHVREGATAQNLAGETKTFTIKPNGKAFRALIDGLYSNKVRSVIRELCSNAVDSHIEAGKADVPFLVTIPTNLDPTFRVRDYGTSLTHDQVMNLYTTLFESSKETTNTQTGMLGLGSKSPFAYTDSFSVVAYLNGEKRVYLAYLETDGVPSITHVGNSPSTEPNGIEVSFPAKRESMRDFQREMQFVAMGYTTPPTVEGMDLKIPKPRMKGNGWAVYPRDAFGSDFSATHFIRQGSAVYPTDQAFPHISYGWVTIVDIPIGTAEVTTSREALSLDDDTRRVIKAVRDNAYLELKAQIDKAVAQAKSRIEVAKVYSQYVGILDNMRGNTVVSLKRDEPGRSQDIALIERALGQVVGQGYALPGERLERADYFGKSATARGSGGRYVGSFDYVEIEKVHILVNDPETKVVRRIKRVRNAWVLNHNRGLRTFVLDVESKVERVRAIRFLKEFLGLDDSRFTVVSTLPDCPPPPSQRKPSMKRVLKPGQLWVRRFNGCVESVFGSSDRGPGEWGHGLIAAARASGTTKLLDWNDVFFVTEKQEAGFRKKGEIDDTTRLDLVIKQSLDNKLATSPLDEAQTLQIVTRQVGSYNKAMTVVLEEFFPDVKITQAQAQEVIDMAIIAKVDLEKRPIAGRVTAKINALSDQYPLLFQKSDPSHFRHYVKAVKATAKP
jgi:hypothetical protein